MSKHVTIRLVFQLLLISLLSCQGDDENQRLLGHWHVFPISPKPAFEAYSTIDVLNDSVAVFDRGVLDKDEGFWGTIDPAESQMRFGGECLILDFHFEVIEDTTLLLSHMQYDSSDTWSFKAVRCSEACCSPEQDYFKHSKVLVSLPREKQSVGAYAYDQFPHSLLRIAYVGRLNQPLAEVYGRTDNALLLGDKISPISDLKEWKSKHLIKLPEQARDRTHTAILCDTSTKVSTIQPILEELQRLGEQRVWFGINSSIDSFSIQWLPVVLSEELDSTIIQYLK
ncbi:hypothetical protein CLV84_0100 [Neolewinella xylanilytica]|uniref:Uncharacterized protein n=1 Tax=Neolewinella xylanilytica TaxID=1514080 RepID=A0A2S6I6M9_9BACT|nr:hypothetical protein [Neolewinella xylanilytica]PPK87166.1 hypothetical protein CLV84_0100 [Neolewinella xylanilytica]